MSAQKYFTKLTQKTGVRREEGGGYEELLKKAAALAQEKLRQIRVLINRALDDARTLGLISAYINRTRQMYL